jgi:hypothetical protein
VSRQYDPEEDLKLIRSIDTGGIGMLFRDIFEELT